MTQVLTVELILLMLVFGICYVVLRMIGISREVSKVIELTLSKHGHSLAEDHKKKPPSKRQDVKPKLVEAKVELTRVD